MDLKRIGMGVLSAGLCLAAAGCDTVMSAADYEKLREEAVNRPRRILWDDDGCDMSHYPFCRADLAKEPASVRNFELVFLEAAERTKVDTVTYSGTYGFGGFTATKAGYFFTNRCAAASDPWRNAAPEFRAMGTDAHRMAIDFAHRNGKEAFLSLRFNDNHDAAGAGDMSSIFITPFKRENRECMMGGDGGAVKCCGWTAMDFAQEKVRAFAKTYIRQFCENYDFDGLLFDFFRHPQLFRTVANGGHATEAELKLMTAFMGELRTMVDEIGRTRGRPFVIGARTPDSADYCRAIGIDLDGWLDAKAIDFLVVGGYFQLEPWAKSAALAHRHGVRCYASLDETRINERKYRALPGRDTEACWIARAAAAVAQGMDGVFYFNFEYDNHDLQRRVMSVDPAEMDGLDKVYFSTHNGSGGYLPRHFLVDGMDYWKLPRIDPGYPTSLASGSTHAFSLPIGDDFAAWRAKGRTPVLTLKLLTDAKAAADIASFTVNGKAVAFAEFKDGLLTANVPPETFRKGDNAVVVRAGAAVTLHDLSLSVRSAADDIAKWDPRMAAEKAVVDTNGVKWIDGKYLPIEGRAFNDTATYYERLTKTVTTNVNAGVRGMKSHTSGLQFRFRTDSRSLVFKWSNDGRAMPHMAGTGVSGIDVYRLDAKLGKWRFVKTGFPPKSGEATLKIGWTPGEACLVNLPLYNGISSFTLGVDPAAKIEALGPRKSGIDKPVVFYGTSITHGGCCSRPGLSFVNIAGRDLDVPVVNLGFSGSGVMELEMSEHLAAIDASCYVLDCLWNMGSDPTAQNVRSVERNYEAFIRNLRTKRPGVPIVMAEQCDVYMNGPNNKDKFMRALYEKLLAEGWTDLVYLPKAGMYAGDLEGTVDGCHPNDLGMMSMAKAFGTAVRQALKLR